MCPEKVKILAKKLPRFKNKKCYVAVLEINKGSGLSLVDEKSTHVDFWMYRSFDPVSALIRVEAI